MGSKRGRVPVDPIIETALRVRKERGISQLDAGIASGVRPNTLCQWEIGATDPIRRVRKYIDSLDIDLVLIDRKTGTPV